MKVIKIGATWCPGCLVMRPVWKRIEAENIWLVTEYYDVDEEKDLVAQHKVDRNLLPVSIFLDKDGNELLRLTGEVPRERILQAIREYRDR